MKEVFEIACEILFMAIVAGICLGLMAFGVTLAVLAAVKLFN